MKIYFAGSIRTGREKVNDYQKIVEYLERYGEVLTKHVADPKLPVTGEKISEEEIYTRDTKWLDECDVVIAEITLPSLGVGYELAYAEARNKEVICMYEEGKLISGMIMGNKNLIKIPYSNVEELLEKLEETVSTSTSK